MERNKKIKIGFVASIALVAALAIFLPSHQAHAYDLLGIGNLAGGAIGWIAYILILVVSTIVGVFIAFVTYLISVVLQLSNNIVITLAVQSGYAVTLAVVNLGFVLGIITIAIATILRRETYGIKKTLWKLVVAAILVNFSLVIGGAIINFSNVFTNAFLTALPGSDGGNGPIQFASQLAGALAPQKALLKFSGSNNNLQADISGGMPQNTSPGTDIASILTPIVSVFSAAALLTVIFITLVVFLFMLLIRYVELSILLVLMPFAWLFWIFPKTSYLWSKWWSEFIRWTFFAPIVVFFLWLAIATAQGMNGAGKVSCTPDQKTGTYCGDLAFLSGTKYQSNNSNPILAGLSSSFGDFIGSFAGTILQGAIVVGLAVGGMYAANKLGIMGASSALGAMSGAGNWAKGYAKSRSRQAITSPLRSQRGRDLSSRMQQRSQNPFLKWTGLDYVKRQTGRVLQAGSTAGGEKAIDAEKKTFEGLTPEQKLNRLSTARGPFQRIQLLKQIAEDKNLGKLSSQELENYLGKDKEAEFKRYGQEKTFKDLREKSGLAFTDMDKELAELKATNVPPGEMPAHEAKIKAKETEKDKALASYIEDNTDAAVEAFTDPEKLKEKREKAAKAGRIPAAIDEKALTNLQTNIARGIAKGLSPHNVSSLISALSKKNNLDGFEEVVGKIRAKDPSLQANLASNAAILKWNDKNVAKGTLDIDLRKVYGLPQPLKQPPRGSKNAPQSGGNQPRVILTDSDVGSNVRETIKFDKNGNPIT